MLSHCVCRIADSFNGIQQLLPGTAQRLCPVIDFPFFTGADAGRILWSFFFEIVCHDFIFLKMNKKAPWKQDKKNAT
jgi:hypothetical protein